MTVSILRESSNNATLQAASVPPLNTPFPANALAKSATLQKSLRPPTKIIIVKNEKAKLD